MVHPNSDDQGALKAKNMHGTSPGRYSNIEHEVSSTIPTGTSGIGATKEPVEDQQS